MTPDKVRLLLALRTVLPFLLIATIWPSRFCSAAVLVCQWYGPGGGGTTHPAGGVFQLGKSEVAFSFVLNATSVITKLVWSGDLQGGPTAGEECVIRFYETVGESPAFEPSHAFETSPAVRRDGEHFLFTAELSCELTLAAGTYWIAFVCPGAGGGSTVLAEEGADRSGYRGGGAVGEYHHLLWRPLTGHISFPDGKGFSLAIHGDQIGVPLDGRKIFFAGDSGGTCCYRSFKGKDLYRESLFSRLRRVPPSGFRVEPDRDITSTTPCSPSHPGESGYGGLKILDWKREIVDARGHSVCSWTCADCPRPAAPGEGAGQTEECCCSSRKGCIDQSDARYVILALLNNDLLRLYDLYNGDVDRVVESAKSIIRELTGQGRVVIWLSYSPIGFGRLGQGEKSCSNLLSCLFAVNSNAEYFYEKLIPWIEKEPGVHIIAFFGHIKERYGSSLKQFHKAYQYDKTHLKPDGHQLYYDFVNPRLQALVAGKRS